MWGDTLVDSVQICAVGETDVNVGILEPESGIDVRRDLVVRLDDILDVGINKVVERVNVLFDEPLDFKEGGQQEPLVLSDGRSR